MTRERRALPGFAFVDFLSNVLLLFMVFFVLSYLLIRPKHAEPAIDTLGVYAIEVTWPRGDVDVDTYVQDPRGVIAWFKNGDAGLMHLEHDDLGRTSDTVTVKGRRYGVARNAERVVLRGVLPGEYVVNVHLYASRVDAPVPVQAVLYRLRGPDEELLRERRTLRGEGEERTVFRFRLDRGGDFTGSSDLPKRLVGDAQP